MSDYRTGRLALGSLAFWRDSWRTGPVRRLRNWSIGVPLWFKGPPAFGIPQAGGNVQYVTRRCGSLAGKGALSLRYRVDCEPGATLHPLDGSPDSPTLLTLYFQRKGDDFTAQDKCETYRWFATFATVAGIEAGEHEIIAPLDANWTALQTSSRENNPQAFADALAHAHRIGFVFGGGNGYGHGVFARGQVRFTVLEFTTS